MGPSPVDESCSIAATISGFFALGRLKPGITVDAAGARAAAIDADLQRSIRPRIPASRSTRNRWRRARSTRCARRCLCCSALSVASCCRMRQRRQSADRARVSAPARARGPRRARRRPTAARAQLLAESTLVSAVGGVLGVVLATWLLAGPVAVAPEGTPRLDEVRLTAPPALLARRGHRLRPACSAPSPRFRRPASRGQRLVDARSRGRRVGGSHRLRRGLMVIEVALALVLLTGAGLMIRTLREHLTRVETRLPAGPSPHRMGVPLRPATAVGRAGASRSGSTPTYCHGVRSTAGVKDAAHRLLAADRRYRS